MLKKLTAVLLAVLMLFGCASTVLAADAAYQIATAEDLKLLAAHPSASFEVADNIDMEGAVWTPVENFSGTLEGNDYEISNFTISGDGVFGFFRENSGTVNGLILATVTTKSNSASVYGLIAGKNTGTIENCKAYSCYAELTAAKDAQIAQIVGENFGKVNKCEIENNLTVSAPLGASVGGICAKNHKTLTKNKASGRMEVSGTADMGLIICTTDQFTKVTGNEYIGNMNTVNGKLINKYIVGPEYGCLKNNEWRDNSNSDEFLTENQYKVRKKVIDYSNAMATYLWMPDRNLTMIEKNTDAASNRSHDKYFKAGDIQVGDMYSHKQGSFERWMYTFDENGNFKDFIVDGADGFDLYFCTDCSGSVEQAYQTVSPNYSGKWVGDNIPDKVVKYDEHPGHGNPYGGVKVGDYTAASTTSTIPTVKKLGYDKTCEIWACTHMGDGGASTTDGHARMVTGTKIMRTQGGKIDGKKSIVYMNGMGDGLSNKVYHIDMVNDYEFSLNTMVNTHWLPFTCVEMRDGIIVPGTFSFTENVPEDRAHLLEGTVTSNYRILCAKLEILNKDGSTCWDKTLWTGVHRWDEANNDDVTREPQKKVDMDQFATSMREAKMVEGKTYTYKLSILLANGDKCDVRQFDFVY